MNKAYLAGPPSKWLHPDDEPPPRSTKIRIWTSEGVEIHGHWADTPLYCLWMPLTKVDPEMRERLRREGKIK